MIIGGGIDLQNNNADLERSIGKVRLFGEISKKEGWTKWFYVVSGLCRGWGQVWLGGVV
jgi:hypothetical protein